MSGDEGASDDSGQETAPGATAPASRVLLPPLRDPRHTQEGTPGGTPERGIYIHLFYNLFGSHFQKFMSS